jgi:translation initiation factor 1
MPKKNEWKKRSGVVFSTDPTFSYREAQNESSSTLPNNKQRLRVYIERNHRQGKEVTIVKNFVGTTADAEGLCRKLKIHCGAGGSVKDSEIIIQGDQRQKVLSYLKEEGFEAKG